MAHREARNLAAQQLAFPHADFRPGQRHLAESVFKAVSTGRCLMAQAPTGIGKTVGTLFPMLKAWRRSNWTRCSSSPPKPRDANWRWMPRR
jgi:DNA excision repair protein ERCC-2